MSSQTHGARRALNNLGAVVGLLLGILVFSSCGVGSPGDGGVAAPAKGSSSSGSPDTDAPAWDTTYEESRPRIDDAALAKFGKADAQAGTDLAVDVTREMAFNQQLMVAQVPEGKQTLLAMTKHMTSSMARDWRNTVAMFTTGTKEQKGEVAEDMYSVTFYGAFERGRKFHGKPFDVNRTGPIAVNPEIKSVKTSVDTLGRLQVKVASQADLRVTHGDSNRVMSVDRDATYYIVKTDGGWKIDGCQASFQVGDLQPEKKSL